jgi:hypothetical protein
MGLKRYMPLVKPLLFNFISEYGNLPVFVY